MPFFKATNYGPSRSKTIDNTTKKNGLRHTIFNTGGDKYIGQWKNNMKSGKGVIITRNEEIYEGDMERNYRHGFGILARRIPNTKKYKLIYKGDWKNGKMHGEGLRIYPDGSFYIGFFRNGKRNGHGQMWWPNGGFFDGYFKDDLKEGLGVMVRSDGNRYEGKWHHDQKHGKGIFLHLNHGVMQEGVWQNDMCVFSQMKAIAFKQASIEPAAYPIPKLMLENAQEVCETAKDRALTRQSADSYESLVY